MTIILLTLSLPPPSIYALKKYKLEKSFVLELGSDHYVPPWPFSAPLNSLIVSPFKPSAKTRTPLLQRKRIQIHHRFPLLPSSVPVFRWSERLPPPTYQPSIDSSFFRRDFSVMAAAAAAIDGADDDSDTSLSSGGHLNRYRNGNVPRRLSWIRMEIRFNNWRKQTEGLQRFVNLSYKMQFSKDLESERMKLLMESRVQVGKLKRLNSNSELGKFNS